MNVTHDIIYLEVSSYTYCHELINRHFFQYMVTGRRPVPMYVHCLKKALHRLEIDPEILTCYLASAVRPRSVTMNYAIPCRIIQLHVRLNANISVRARRAYTTVPVQVAILVLSEN